MERITCRFKNPVLMDLAESCSEFQKVYRQITANNSPQVNSPQSSDPMRSRAIHCKTNYCLEIDRSFYRIFI
jgi:hypothetical protein